MKAASPPDLINQLITGGNADTSTKYLGLAVQNYYLSQTVKLSTNPSFSSVLSTKIEL